MLRARVMGRGNNSSNLPTQFYWISSRQLLLAPFCRLPVPLLTRAGLVALHVSFARTLVAAPQVCACKSQREVITTGSPRRGWTRMLWPPGSPTRMRVHPPWRAVNLFAKKNVSIERQRHGGVTARYSLTLFRELLAID